MAKAVELVTWKNRIERIAEQIISQAQLHKGGLKSGQQSLRESSHGIARQIDASQRQFRRGEHLM